MTCWTCRKSGGFNYLFSKKPMVSIPSIFGQMMHDDASSLRLAAWGHLPTTQEMMREDRWFGHWTRQNLSSQTTWWTTRLIWGRNYHYQAPSRSQRLNTRAKKNILWEHLPNQTVFLLLCFIFVWIWLWVKTLVLGWYRKSCLWWTDDSPSHMVPGNFIAWPIRYPI